VGERLDAPGLQRLAGLVPWAELRKIAAKPENRARHVAGFRAALNGFLAPFVQSDGG